MDLLSDLQFASLRELIKPITHEITLPFTEGKASDSLLLVDTAKHNASGTIIDALASQLSEGPGLMVLLDTTYSWRASSLNCTSLKSKTTTEQFANFIVHSEVPTIGSLMKTLREISTGEFFQNKQHQQLPVKCVVIDNISVFKLQTDTEHTTTQEYTTLGNELGKLQTQMGCTIVVKSWDRGFSNGVVKRLPLETSHNNPPSYWTGLPHGFTDGFEHVYYLQRSRDGKVSGQYFQKCSQTSVLIDKNVI